MKLYKYFSLVQGGEDRRRHEHDALLPRVIEQSNMYSSKSDRVPTTRHDLAKDTRDLLAYSDDLSGSPSIDDYICLLIQLSDGTELAISTLVPFIFDGATPVVKAGVYNDNGTVSGTATGSVITGSSTFWKQNVWPGCIITEDTNSKEYLILSVDSDTQVTVDGTLEDTFAGATYSILRTHSVYNTGYPLNIQIWNYNIIYQPVRIDGIKEDQISGPMQNVIAGLNYGWPTSALIFKAFRVWKLGTWWFRSHTGAIYRTQDPTSWSSTSSGITTSIDMYAGASTIVSVAAGNVHESTDLTGATFNPVTSLPGSGIGTIVISDGATQWVIAGEDSGVTKIWESTNLAGAWTERASNFLSDIISTERNGTYTGTIYYIGGEGQSRATCLYESTDGISWSASDLSGTSLAIYSITDIASSGVVHVAVGKVYSSNEAGIIYNNGDGWKDSNISKSWTRIEYSGKYFLASSATRTNNNLAFSGDGVNWTFLNQPYGQVFQAIPSDITMPNMLIRNVFDLYYDELLEAEFSEFFPISNDYRSVTFTVARGYLILFAVSEWNEDTDSWVHYPRRARWSAPGEVNSFDGEGASFLDFPGTSKIVTSITINNSPIIFETDGIGVLSYTGIFNSPWGYRKAYVGPRIISNPIELNNMVFYIEEAGRLMKTNESGGAQPVGDFDLTKFVDFDQSGPIWLDYSEAYSAFTVWKRGDTDAYLVSMEVGSVSRYSLYDALTVSPRSFFSYKQNDGTKLCIGYRPISDSSKCVVSYYDTSTDVAGVDVIDNISEFWHAEILTGENRLSSEGTRVTISEIELKTSAEDNGDFITFEIRSEKGGVWQRVGDTNGTIELTTSTCVGTDTVWSNKIADGNDVTVVFDSQVSASIMRFYRDSTLLVLGTDYTITDTKEITLTSALLTGEELFGYWSSYPIVIVDRSDHDNHILDEDQNFHLVSSVDYYDELTLSTYPPSTQVGQHYSTYEVQAGDGKLIIGNKAQLNEFQLRIYVIPANQSKYTKIYGYLVRFNKVGPEMRK